MEWFFWTNDNYKKKEKPKLLNLFSVIIILIMLTTSNEILEMLIWKINII